MDSIRTIGMSQTKAVRWIRLDCLMLRVNVVSKLLLMFILILYIVLLKCYENRTRGIIHNKKQNKTHENFKQNKIYENFKKNDHKWKNYENFFV